MTGTDVATYARERPGMSAFALEDGVVHHTYSAYARGTGRPLVGLSVARPRARGAMRQATGGATTTATTKPERIWG